MAPKKPESTEGSAERDTIASVLTELAALTKRTDAFMASIRGDMAATRELVGRLEDRINQLHARHNEMGAEWREMRETMRKHHHEQSTGAVELGSAVRRTVERVDQMEKAVQHASDPHLVVRPVKAQLGELQDSLAILRAQIDRRFEALQESGRKRGPA